MCPGNVVVFTCQQSGSFLNWEINLLSETLQQVAQSSQNGSKLTIMNGHGFHFEVHIVSNSSNTITSELHIIAVRELNGINVICGGSTRLMYTIQVASVGELINSA